MVHWQYCRPPLPAEMLANSVPVCLLRLGLHLLIRGYLRAAHGLAGGCAGRGGAYRGHLVVANHASHLDAPVLMSLFPLLRVNRVFCICAREYFHEHLFRRWIGFLLCNTIPIDRDRYDAASLALCRDRLARGAAVILFPEGTRSGDGTIQPFKGGVGVLAGRYGLPVLPVGIGGTFACLPKGRRLPRAGRVAVKVGEPVRYPRARRRAEWDRIAADLRRRVAELACAAVREETGHEHVADRRLSPAAADLGPVQ